MVTVDIQPVVAERTIAVPVRLDGLGEGRSARPVPLKVTVTVRGREDLVSALDEGAVGAAASLSGLGAGRHSVAVRVSTPEGIAVAAIVPPEVRVTIR